MFTREESMTAHYALLSSFVHVWKLLSYEAALKASPSDSNLRPELRTTRLRAGGGGRGAQITSQPRPPQNHPGARDTTGRTRLVPRGALATVHFKQSKSDAAGPRTYIPDQPEAEAVQTAEPDGPGCNLRHGGDGEMCSVGWFSFRKWVGDQEIGKVLPL